MFSGKKLAWMIKALAICLLSAGMAIGFNMFRPHPYEFSELNNPQPPGIEELSTPDLLALIDSGAVQVVDARSDMDFAMGHVPGAISIPSWAIGDELEAMVSKLDKRAPVVVYCDGLSCGKSKIVAKKLIKSGCRDVMVYSGGIDGWLGAGRDLEAN